MWHYVNISKTSVILSFGFAQLLESHLVLNEARRQKLKAVEHFHEG